MFYDERNDTIVPSPGYVLSLRERHILTSEVNRKMEISEWKWKSFDDLDMYSRGWMPEGAPKALIILVHGLGEHVGRFDHIGAALAETGYALLGTDLRGHGRSGGPRGHTPSDEAFTRDIDSMLEQAEARYPVVPKFLYGLSMGGTLVLQYILRRKPALAGAIVSAPGLRSPVLEQKGKLMLAKVLGAFLPTFSMPTGLDANMLSHIPAVVEGYKSDPLVHDRSTLAMANIMSALPDWIFDHANELNIPLLIIHGTDDKIVYPRGSREFAQKADGNVTLKEWNGLYHELHNEPERDQVLAYLIDWLDKLQVGLATDES